ncbi:hypothetical protein [Streptomyces sp. NPDC058657]|uniref:hypothetical protein n=1 Tax=unclassified Streptomyces TaxID=2593676 RepID=UPI0036473367
MHQYPRALVVRLPEGRVMLSRRLTAPVCRNVVAHLAGQGSGPPSRTEDGDPYTLCPPGLLVEALAGITTAPAVRDGAPSTGPAPTHVRAGADPRRRARCHVPVSLSRSGA